LIDRSRFFDRSIDRSKYRRDASGIGTHRGDSRLMPTPRLLRERFIALDSAFASFARLPTFQQATSAQRLLQIQLEFMGLLVDQIEDMERRLNGGNR
jgi:hypothetical protein